LVSSSQWVRVLVVVVQLIFLEKVVMENGARPGALEKLLWNEVVSVDVDALRDDGGLCIYVVVGCD
jgi:uncharacterized membrane protein AbrB (regulator of aidB expression)